MSQTLKNRLRRLEKNLPEDYSEIIRLIKQGAFYDDLSEEQKDLYCQYKECNREAMETVRKMVLETEGKEDPEGYLHFKLSYKEKEPTPEEFERTRKEVEQLVLAAEEDLQEEMNINDVLKN